MRRVLKGARRRATGHIQGRTMGSGEQGTVPGTTGRATGGGQQGPLVTLLSLFDDAIPTKTGLFHFETAIPTTLKHFTDHVGGTGREALKKAPF